MTERHETHSERETTDLARRFAASLPGGAVLLLYGELGAGKTAFVRGVVAGVGGDPADVSSPTFTLVQPYDGGSLTIQHVDLYRLETRDVPDLGLDELSTSSSIVVVEWAERMDRPPPGAIHVRIADRDGDDRAIEIERGD